MRKHSSLQQDTPMLFDDVLAPAPDLAKTFSQMRAAGYVLEAPRMALHSHKPWHTEWHVYITHSDVRFALAFCIPDDSTPSIQHAKRPLGALKND